MHQCIKFILFWNGILRVTDGLSVYHQEFKTVHTAASICQIDIAVGTVLNSWWWTERPSETCRASFQNKIKLIHWCIWLVILRCTALWTSKMARKFVLCNSLLLYFIFLRNKFAECGTRNVAVFWLRTNSAIETGYPCGRAHD